MGYPFGVTKLNLHVQCTCTSRGLCSGRGAQGLPNLLPRPLPVLKIACINKGAYYYNVHYMYIVHVHVYVCGVRECLHLVR